MIDDISGDSDLSDALADAQLMLTAFQRAGADYFDLTLKNLAGEKVKFQCRLSAGSFRSKLLTILDQAEQAFLSIIIRPHPRSELFIQLDDINAAAVGLISEFSFLVIETSPGNYQAFVAISKLNNKLEGESIRRQLIKIVSADEGATGAVRLAGSLNVKEKHRTADGIFPRVKLISVAHGRIFTASELIAAGLIEDLPIDLPPQISTKFNAKKSRLRRAPIYEMAVGAVKPKQDGNIDRSAVDAHYAVVCLDWGFTIEETISLLRTNSPKAAERSDGYVEKTVSWAREQIARRTPNTKPRAKKRTDK